MFLKKYFHRYNSYFLCHVACQYYRTLPYKMLFLRLSIFFIIIRLAKVPVPLYYRNFIKKSNKRKKIRKVVLKNYFQSGKLIKIKFMRYLQLRLLIEILLDSFFNSNLNSVLISQIKFS
jgi:hypothetical protein